MGKKSKILTYEAQLQEQANYEKFRENSCMAKRKNNIPSANPFLEIQEFSDYFIRDPHEFSSRLKTQNHDKRLCELVRHTFNQYRVAPFLYNAWTSYKSTTRNYNETGNQAIQLAIQLTNEAFQWRTWYICIAQGRSLYKEYASKQLTRAEVHAFVTCPLVNISLCQGVIFAIAKAAGASIGLASKISCTKLADRSLFSEFWKNAVRFFTRHPEVTKNQIDDFVDYLTWRLADSKETFTINGYNLTTLARRSEDWHRSATRTKSLSHGNWEPMPIDDFTIIRGEGPSKITWFVNQITTGARLAEEGNKMHHCVAWYKNECINGSKSIWSMTSWDYQGKGKHNLTIELNRDNVVVQARGYANRKRRSDESNILSIWARQNGIIINC